MLKFVVRSRLVKVKYSENATKIRVSIPLFFTVQTYTKINCYFFSRFVAFSPYLNFIISTIIAQIFCYMRCGSKKIRIVFDRINSDLSEIKATVGYRCCATWNHSLFFEKPFIFLGVFYQVLFFLD